MRVLKYVHSDMTPDVYRGGGGIVGKVVETATGGMVKSSETKDKLAAAQKAEDEQRKLIKEQADLADKEEADRKKSMLKKRQGRRSLMFSETDETGVDRSTTLGG